MSILAAALQFANEQQCKLTGAALARLIEDERNKYLPAEGPPVYSTIEQTIEDALAGKYRRVKL